MSREDDPPAVGYKKPPQASRFQKGRSGNPSGRRKGGSNSTPKDSNEPFLSKKMRAKIAGKQVWLTKREVAYERLFSIAMGGNVPAFALLFKLDIANDNKTDAELSLSDEEAEALIARFLARRRSAVTGGDDG